MELADLLIHVKRVQTRGRHRYRRACALPGQLLYGGERYQARLQGHRDDRL